MTPEAAFGSDFFGLVCSFALVCLRIWIFARSNRQHTLSQYGTEVSVVLAFFADLGHGVVEYWRDFREIHEMKLHPGENIDKYVVDKTFAKLYFNSVMLYTAFLWLVKASFLFMYWDLSGNMTRRMRVFLYITTGYCAGTFIATLLMKFFWCRPLSENWSTKPGHCNIAVSYTINTCTFAYNVSCDVALILLFISLVYSLRLRRRELYASVFVLAIGSCTVVAASIRYGLIYNSIKGSNQSLAHVRVELVWTRVEMGLSLLAACLPVLRVFLRATRQGSGSGSGRSGSVALGWKGYGKHVRAIPGLGMLESKDGVQEEECVRMAVVVAGDGRSMGSDMEVGSRDIRVRNEVSVCVERQGSSESMNELWPLPPKTS